jgi:hypothetical protein
MAKTPVVERVASGLETHRVELQEMLTALNHATINSVRRAETIEHITRAKHAVGLARATLLGDN